MQSALIQLIHFPPILFVWFSNLKQKSNPCLNFFTWMISRFNSMSSCIVESLRLSFKINGETNEKWEGIVKGTCKYLVVQKKTATHTCTHSFLYYSYLNVDLSEFFSSSLSFMEEIKTIVNGTLFSFPIETGYLIQIEGLL